MRKLYLVLILFLASVRIDAQPDVLFLLPGESTIIASRVFNLFKEFYRGNSYWQDESSVSQQTISNYNHVVQIKEESNQYGNLSLNINTYFGSSRGNKTLMRYNSEMDKLSIYKILVLEIVFDLIKDLDPDYFEELRKVFEELSEVD